MKYIINEKYRELEPFIRELIVPNWFNNNGTTLHEGRNTIKMFEVNGVRLAVKRYGGLSLLNKIVYCTLRKSKARRAYEYARRLRELKIGTPHEVAYIEIRKNGLLRQNYFVSLYTTYNSMLPLFFQKELSSKEFTEIMPLLDDLTLFLYQIHQAGIIHNDLNYTNILYSTSSSSDNGGKFPNGYDFTLIDINRMDFYKSMENPQPLPLKKRIHNMRRLNVSIEAHIYIMKRYASLMSLRAQDLQLPVTSLRYHFENKQQRKQKLKNRIKGA